jgi:Uma2 family endonuclease
VSIISPITEQAYRDLALREPTLPLELWDGTPQEKPPMSMTHGDVMAFLAVLLQNQLDRRAYRIRVNHDRLRVSPRRYYIPDVAVIPTADQTSGWGDPEALAAFAGPLSLVVEIWSPSTGDYDIETKLRGYRERSDHEIWRIQPYERSLTAWRRMPDGSYAAVTYRGGNVPTATLPNVAFDLDVLLCE